MTMSPHHRAISPPTPAPSPQPDLRSSLRLASALSQTGSSQQPLDPNDPTPLLKHVSLALPQLTHQARFRFLSGLIDHFDLRELAHLSAQLAPRLKVDFLSNLPIEVSLHIISFIDDPKTLARASRVSRFWRSLVNDEHTWKVMCLKHKYRRRRSSSAGLGKHIRDLSSIPSRSLIRDHRQGSLSGDSASVMGLLPLSEVGAGEEEEEEEEDEQLPFASADEDDYRVLASLYQRYRARGLDPSNALYELRTLHDLFLSKQEASNPGASNLADQMDEADRAFYAQLEEIVAEESRERYGDDTGLQDETSYSTPGVPMLSSFSSMSAGTTGRATGGASEEPGAAPPLAGWLSAGPNSATAGTRSAAFAGSISNTYRTPTGRLNRLQGWQAGLPTFGRAATASSSAAAPNALGLGGAGAAIDEDATMDMDKPESSAATQPVPQTPVHVIGCTSGLPQMPYHDSPTSRFSTHSGAEAGTSQSRRGGVLVPGRSRLQEEDDGDIFPVRAGKAREVLVSDLLDDGASGSSKKARRRSAPVTDVDGQTIGMGRPSGFGDAARSATLGVARGSVKPFSYRTHFKMQYLTESNWLRGGRLQTQHVSADNGSVVTSLAIDSEWIVVGMANSKIHVFDAETGLYAHTLLGHESGVWCLTLVRRCSKKRRTNVSAKGKMVVTNPEDGLGGRPYEAAADGDLRLIHHDARPDATTFTISPEMLEADERPQQLLRSRLTGGFSRSSSHSLAFDSQRTGGNDETLEWFHKARKALLQKSTSSSAVNLDSGAENSDADSSGEAVKGRSAGARRTSSRLAAAAVAQEDSERAMARAIAEAEAGAVRDAVMVDGTGSVPTNLAEEINRNQEATGSGASGEAAAAAASATQMVGNAAGLGNPCGSVCGYGNEDAVVVSGGCDRDVRVWDLRTGECRFVLRGHTSTTRCLKVLDGRPLAVSGSRDSTLRVWDIEKGEHLHLLAGHQHSVRCMEVAGHRVASGSYDCTCRIWNVETGECEHVLRGHIHQIYAVAFDGNKVATGSLDSTVRVWSASTGECLALFQGHTSLVGQLQLLDNILVTGGSDGRVIIFSLENFECLHRLCAHDNSVTCLQFDDRYIITGGNDGRVKLWDFATGKFIREICPPCEQVWKVNYKDDKVVVLCKRGEKTCMDVITFKPTAEQF